MIHHDRLIPVKSNEVDNRHDRVTVKNQPSATEKPIYDNITDNIDDSESDSEYSSIDENIEINADLDAEPMRRYPERNRVQRNIEGAIPWSALEN